MASEATVIKVRLADLRAIPRAVWQETYISIAEGREFVIFRIGDRYLTVERHCPHKKADLARFGYPKEDEGIILCTAHAHEFRLDTGRCLFADTCQAMRAYATHVNATDGTIEITPRNSVLEDSS